MILLIIASLATGIIYGTDVFFALIVKKAIKHSKDTSIADLIAWIHIIADKRMPVIGIISIISTIIYLITSPGWLPLIAIISLLSHLALYLGIAKPINTIMSIAAKENKTLPNIRALQEKWDRIIPIRAILLTIAMIALLTLSHHQN